MGVIARALESRGISTVSVMVFREVAELTKPPRALHARFPFGRPLGEPGNADQQRVMIQDSLNLLMGAREPGTLLSLPYRWRREDFSAILKQRSAGGE